jgi:hypothetical protein
VRSGAVDVGDSHDGACAREQLTGGGAEPAAAAGHEHETAFERIRSTRSTHAAAAMPTPATSDRLPERTPA